ncbi:MAG: TauD/TfdA family dioxygenase [bacterium]|nr:TauD/TfdA family dioxygenase [bacterium]
MSQSVNSLDILPDRRIVLNWADGERNHYHFVWLRQQHFHPAIGRSDQASDDAFRLPDDPASLDVVSSVIENGELVVQWADDGVVTRHDLAWLRRNAYDGPSRLGRKVRQQTWTGSEAAAFPWLDWETLLVDDEALLAFEVRLRDYGFARVRGAPAGDDEVARLAERLGVLRNTDFGPLAMIETRPPSKKGRYTNLGAGGWVRLAPHTDEGWRYAPPGISFHLGLESTPGEGGESILVDGLLAARRLAARDADAFDFLTRQPFRFCAERNPQERYVARGRMIVTDQDGEVVGIRFSDRTLGVQDLDEAKIEPAYKALGAFAREIYRADLVYRHKLQPGECHVFDNHRILHARTEFDPGSGPRRIAQCSVDREEFHNSYRQLCERLGRMDDANLILPNGALG